MGKKFGYEIMKFAAFSGAGEKCVCIQLSVIAVLKIPSMKQLFVFSSRDALWPSSSLPGLGGDLLASLETGSDLASRRLPLQRVR